MIMTLSREDILNAMRSVLEPLDTVHAMWEGGAAAFGRVDQWSDIDVQVICDDDSVPDVFERVEKALVDLSPIDLKYRIPEPTWHGHSQAFYRLADAGPFLLLDFVVMKKSSERRLREREIHGESVVHFNKNGVLVEENIDPVQFDEKLTARLEQMPVTFDMFQSLVLKELHRGNDVEALQFYHGMTLRPLLELLRILHCPARFNFHTRYFYYDLPSDVIERLEPLFFVSGPEDLRQKHQEAIEWFWEVQESLKGKVGSVNGGSVE